jgi:chorismate lyase / 3-hydroxybenzoate synthase
MRPSRGLHLDYVSRAEFQAAQWPDVLGVATFNGVPRPGSSGPTGIPIAQVSTPVLSKSAQVYEVWRCGEEAESGHHAGVRFRRTEEMLFGCIAVTEQTSNGGTSPLHEATTQAYQEICGTLDAEGCPHLLRVWNYLADINRDTHGTERYRQFNSARQDALRASGRALTGNVPAASALGSPSDSPLVVYFLAGRTEPTFVENPRQVSAYDYPAEYGVHSPVFSRATVLRQPGGLTLFISGTSSIVGHRSLHPGDARAQTRETLTNIKTLVAEANRVVAGARFTAESLACKVYVRRPADLPVIQAEIHAELGDSPRAIFLQADICRHDLSVEIEAAGMCPVP